MAQLTGQAALDYIKSHPNGGYKVIDPGGYGAYFQQSQNTQPQDPQSKNGISGFLGGFFKQPLQLGKNLINDIGTLGSMAVSGGKNTGSPMIGSKQDYWNRLEQANTDPNALAVQTLKNAAGTVAFGVPAGGGLFGTGLGGAVKASAVAGGLGGFGASAPGQELESIGTGALFGGVTGGVLNKAGGLFGKSKIGKSLQKKIFTGLKASDVEMTPNQFNLAKTSILDDLGLKGIKVNTGDDVANALPDLISSYSDDIARNSTELPGAKQDILSDIVEKYGKGKNGQKQLAGIFKDPQMARVKDALNALPDNPQALDLVKVNQLIKEVGGSYKGVTEGGAGLKKQILTNIRSKIRGNIKGPVDNFLTKQSYAIKFAEKMTKAAEKTLGPRYMGLGANVKNPVQQMASRIGRAGEGIGEKMSTSKIPGILGQVAPILAGQQGAITQEDLTQPQGQLPVGLETTGLFGGQGAGMTQEQQQSKFIELVNSGYSPTEAQTIMKNAYGTGGGKTIPATQLADLGDTQAALQNLGTLNEQFQASQGAFGPIEGKLRSLNPWDQSAQQAKATIFTVKQIIGKGLEGGVLRKEDEYKYAQILPKLSDTSEQVAYKIQLLQKVLTVKYQNRVQMYQQGGYNTSAITGGYSTGGGNEMNTEDYINSSGLSDYF